MSFYFVAGSSIIVAFMSVYINDGEAVQSKGFFQGYTKATWAVISLGVCMWNMLANKLFFWFILKGALTSFGVMCKAIAHSIQSRLLYVPAKF